MVTSVHPYGTFGSLTFRVSEANLALVILPLWLETAAMGVSYEACSFVLCGSGVRGGPLVV